MTELNHTTETDPDRGDAHVTWPAVPVNPAEAGDAAGNTGSRDPDVDALLDRLGQLPELPVARHGEVYAGLHDDLLAALNESVNTTATGDATHEQA
ncbi:hypothetical protein [Arthrobacter sp. Leaf69]|uniref:hypothetical protein n=1 Tax=Arthrobacter sp. Leaf69 TaxID=1736232 RepID=UPI0006FC432C|nr:hypothetical protein [Arthrobacter sp. Leaf69]KQN86335.1 hypothetical protein ASE96_12125 [Arthrobacter sp. Leaf69]